MSDIESGSQDAAQLEAPLTPGPLFRIIRDKRVAFLFVGAMNTAIGFGLYTLFFALFHDIPTGYMIALVLAQITSAVCAFVLYRTLVFRVRGHVVRDFFRFVSVYVVAFGVNLVALPLMVEVLHLHPLLAQVVIIAITTVLSYVGHNYFSFRRKEVEP